MDYAYDRQNSLMTKVYAYMASGMGVSAVTAIAVANTPSLLALVLSPFGSIISILAGLFLVFGMSFFGKNLSETGVRIMYFTYTFVSGLMLSSIFVITRWDRSPVCSLLPGCCLLL